MTIPSTATLFERFKVVERTFEEKNRLKDEAAKQQAEETKAPPAPLASSITATSSSIEKPIGPPTSFRNPRTQAVQRQEAEGEEDPPIKIELPDNTTREWVTSSKAIKPRKRGVAEDTGFRQIFRDPQKSLSDADLLADEGFIEASKVLYRMNEGLFNFNEATQGDNQWADVDFGNYGLKFMGWFNWHLPTMTLEASRIEAATPEQKHAFLYAMDATDALGVSWAGAGRLAKGFAADPLTYTGLFSFGAGTLIGAGAKTITKAGVRTLLWQTLRGGTVAGTETALYSAVEATNREMIRSGGAEVDIGRVAEEAGLGGLAGFGVGSAVTAGVKLLTRKSQTKQLTDIVKKTQEALFVPVGPQVAVRTPEGPGTVVKDEDYKITVVFEEAPDTPGEAIKHTQKVFKADQVTSTARRDVASTVHGVEPTSSLPAKQFDPAKNLPGYADETGQAQRLLDTADSSKMGGEALLPMDDVERLVPKAVAPLTHASFQAVWGILTALVRKSAPDIPGTRADGTLNLKALSAQVQPLVAKLLDLQAPPGAAATEPQHIRSLFEVEATQRLTGLPEGVTAGAFYTPLFRAINEAAFLLKTKIYNLQVAERAHAIVGDTEDAFVAIAIRDEIEQLDNILRPINDLDVAISSWQGKALVARQGQGNTGEIRTLTGEHRDFHSAMQKRLEEARIHNIPLRTANSEMESARRTGRVGDWLQAKREVARLEAELTDDFAQQSGHKQSRAYAYFNKGVRVANEIMIGFVFSPATTLVNALPSLAKTIYKPALENIALDGLTKASMRRRVAEYSAMASMAPTALRAARAAFRYERSLLTGDSGRFYEDKTVLPKKYGIGGIVRFFPRTLLATDAFFETIHYRGYVVGQAAGEALESGLTKGLKGAALDKHVDKAVREAVAEAYEPAPNLIDILYDTGISRGYRGDRLRDFIETERLKEGAGLLSATNKEGRDYVQDVLFKREFSGEGQPSGVAKGYEAWVNRNPIVRAMGQLFFRTPVRVFEEGIRLTPGVNIVHPKFRRDLLGENGAVRQARAHGEALFGLSIAATVMTWFSTGSITGAMDENYKRRRTLADRGEKEPYHIYFPWTATPEDPHGKSFNYRNLDPFATPIKIMVNALERMQMLDYRKSQGDKISEAERMELKDAFSIAIGSIVQSIRDANLATGIDSIAQAVESTMETGIRGDEELVRFLSDIASRFVPNTWYKVQALSHPGLADPQTLGQTMLSRIDPDNPLVPKQYTPLGRERILSNPGANLWYFDLVTPAERHRGVPEKEREVLEFISHIERVADTHFTASTRHRDIPTLDLRGMLTQDGEETLYDRWMRFYRETDVVKTLYQLKTYLTEKDVGITGLKRAGLAESDARNVINKYRGLAWERLVQSENLYQIINRYATRLEVGSQPGATPRAPPFNSGFFNNLAVQRPPAPPPSSK